MNLISQIGVGLIACFHLYIMWFEMFSWENRGKKVFRSFPKHLFKETKVMAANQGLYNGFLAAGLIWSLLITSVSWQIYVALFFLGCVTIAGIYGAFSADRKIFFVQGLPAIIVIILIHF